MRAITNASSSLVCQRATTFYYYEGAHMVETLHGRSVVARA